jgi:ribonuclease R
VCEIHERAHETLVGLYQGRKGSGWVVPDNGRLPSPIIIRHVTSNSVGEKVEPPPNGEKVLVRLDEWENPNQNPTGIVIERLGRAGDPGVDMLAIIREYALPERFPADVLEEVAPLGSTVRGRDIEGREDFRNDCVITIDPDDARDHDDAVCVKPLSGGGWELWVHIADVSHYVPLGSALDREARLRGNSTYLPDRVIPMIPEPLSAGLCSLHEGVDRLTVSVRIRVSDNGETSDYQFTKGVIRVAAGLTYRKAFAVLSSAAEQPALSAAVREQIILGWEVSSRLRKRRMEAGSLDLDFPEVKVWLDGDGRAVRLERIHHDISHQLIEEQMLAANEAVARELMRRLVPAIHRAHEKPEPTRLNEFRDLAASFGFRVGDLTERREMQKLLRIIQGKPEEYRVKLELLKSLRRAAYSADSIGHYGLAKTYYTHFTSPIRRYADLLVHRVLTGQSVPSREFCVEIAEHISTTERNSAAAERDAVQLKKIEYFVLQLEARTPEVYDATVTDVRPLGLLIELPELDTTGLVPMETIPGGPWQFDSVRVRLVQRRSNAAIGLGANLRVQVLRVDPVRKLIDFAIADAGSRRKRKG